MANQDTEDKAREANKRLQEEGAARMNKHRVYSEPMEVWPPNIQLMVERGYFNPKEESPLKNHDWREDIVDKYNQMKSGPEVRATCRCGEALHGDATSERAPSGHSGDGRGSWQPRSPDPGSQPHRGGQDQHPADAHPIEPRTGEAHGGQMDQGSPCRGGHRVAYLGRGQAAGPQALDLPGGPHTPLMEVAGAWTV